MSRKNLIWSISLVAFVLIIILFVLKRGEPSGGSRTLYATVEKGSFVVTVSTSGEAEAQNSVKIYGPQNLRSIRVWNVKILDIVPEGTKVKKGEWVAQLEKTEVAEKLKSQELELEEKLLELKQAKIDTSISLQQARNNLENLQANMLEKELEVEKSVYEPPVIIKQAQAEYERSRRQYEQAKTEYKLNLTSAISKVQRENIRIQKGNRDVELHREIMKEFEIYAPEDGMVIYRKGRNGEKSGVGAMLNVWELIVAELPDLTLLNSKTFVNEVDIRKIKEGQKVNISFDAFPDKHMQGEVRLVANVGTTVQGGKAKVFQVDIKIEGSDADIKPGMTTGNTIITLAQDEVLHLPIETVFSQGDSIQYVFLQQKFGVIKKQVKSGNRNEQDVIIAEGLEEGDKVRFLPPEDSDDLEFQVIGDNSISEVTK